MSWKGECTGLLCILGQSEPSLEVDRRPVGGGRPLGCSPPRPPLTPAPSASAGKGPSDKQREEILLPGLRQAEEDPDVEGDGER